MIEDQTFTLNDYPQFHSNLTEFLINHCFQPIGCGYPDGRLFYVNEAFCQLVGYSKEELYTLKWSTDLTPTDWQGYENKFLEKLKITETPIRYEKEYLRKDGSRVPIEVFVHQASDNDGRIQFYYAFFTDLTERKKIEHHLLMMTERYQSLFTNSLDGILITRQDGSVLDANPAACQFFGKTKEELIKEESSRIIDLTDPRLLTALRVREQTGKFVGELTYLKKDGTKFEAELSSCLVTTKESKKLAYIIFRDISERKRMREEIKRYRHHLEELVKYRTCELGSEVQSHRATGEQLKATNKELEQSQMYLRTIFDRSIIGVVLLDLNSGESLCNPAFQQMLGYSADELKTMSFKDFTHPQDLEQELKLYHESIESKTDRYQIDKRYIRKDGTVMWGRLSLSINRNTEGKPHYVIGMVEDISDRVKTQQELSRLERLNTIGQLAAGIGHEIRNPLTTIRGFLQLLSNKPHYIEDSEYFEIMISELDRAKAILNDFLSLARNHPVDLKTDNLNQILNDLFPLLQADAFNSNKDIIIETLPLPDINLNKQELHQLILNMVRNGLDAIQEGDSLRISTYMDKDYVVLAINDQGPGIDPDILSNIGTPFLTTKSEGTGLGLAVCYQIARRHQAKIEIDTGPNGTTFYIKFSSITT